MLTTFFHYPAERKHDITFKQSSHFVKRLGVETQNIIFYKSILGFGLTFFYTSILYIDAILKTMLINFRYHTFFSSYQMML